MVGTYGFFVNMKPSYILSFYYLLLPSYVMPFYEVCVCKKKTYNT